MAGSIWGRDPSYKVIASGVLSCPIQHVTCTISFEGLPSNNDGYGLVTLDYLPWTGGHSTKNDRSTYRCFRSPSHTMTRSLRPLWSSVIVMPYSQDAPIPR